MRGDVVPSLVRQAMLPVRVGITAGTLATLASGRLLENQLFGIEANDPWTLLGVAALLGAAAFVASYLPSRRVARTDPRGALFSP